MSNFKGAVALVTCLLGGLSAAGAAADPVSARSRTDQLIIQFSDDDSRRIQSVGRDQVVPDIFLPDGRRVKFRRHFEDNAIVVQLPDELSLEEARLIAGQLAAQPGIASVQPDKRMFPALFPNDPEYPPGQDAIQDPGQWHLFEDTAGINLPAAWDQSTGSAAIVVAVLDTGIISHRDLDAGRVLPGYDFISDTFTANDGDGRDSDPTDPGDWAELGDPCFKDDPDEDNSSWHGMSVASVIVATSDNNTDIAGIDFAARLLPIRVLGKCGGSLSDVADAIRWAAGLPVAGVSNNPNPADVINLSLSGDGACSQFEQDAINAAVAAGAVVVAAAGNEGGNVQDISPANCDNVITVGAIARDGKIASYVNVGPRVDLTVPGGDTPDPEDLTNNPPNGILTLSNFGTTIVGADALASIQGTSFTAAQVSAVASLMLAIDATLSPTVVEDILKATTRAFPDASCTTALCGTGVLDASAALAGAADPSSVLGNRANTSGGGGGCSLSTGAVTIDPLMGFILMLAGLLIACRRQRG